MTAGITGSIATVPLAFFDPPWHSRDESSLSLSEVGTEVRLEWLSGTRNRGLQWWHQSPLVSPLMYFLAARRSMAVFTFLPALDPRCMDPLQQCLYELSKWQFLSNDLVRTTQISANTIYISSSVLLNNGIMVARFRQDGISDPFNRISFFVAMLFGSSRRIGIYIIADVGYFFLKKVLNFSAWDPDEVKCRKFTAVLLPMKSAISLQDFLWFIHVLPSSWQWSLHIS